MDKSLDEIISTKPKTGRRGGAPRRRAPANTGRGAILGKPAHTPVQKVSVVAATKAANAAAPTIADKIIVSGLPLDVNEAQVKDLFAQTIGPVREVSLTYNSQGKSKGTATVHFSRKGDGNKAYQQYNNRLIDGSQPMKIEIVVDPIRAVPLASRVAPAPKAAAAAAPQPRAAAPAKRRPARAPRVKQTPKTAADLDAEMEDYTAAASAPAAPAAAAAAPAA